MFGDKFEKQFALVARDIDPYRNMGVQLEVDQRLKDLELELLGYNRHLLTSNDRYQMTSAYLTLAQNRAILMDAIYDGLAAGKNAKKSPDIDPAVVSDFMAKGYDSAQHGLEEADRVAAHVGYKAGPDEVNKFTAYARDMHWPGQEVLSNPFVVGCVNAIDNLLANATVRYSEITNNTQLPNDFKMEIKKQLQAILGEAQNRKKAVERITGGITSSIESEPVMLDIYKNVAEAFSFVDQAGVWLSIPRINNPVFTLSRPLDEQNPTQRSFKASEVIAQPIVRQTVQQKPVAPPAPAKPFDPSTLTPPAPAPPEKHFDIGTLHPAAPATPAAPEKHFDASTLQPATPAPAPKHFDPADLNKGKS